MHQKALAHLSLVVVAQLVLQFLLQLASHLQAHNPPLLVLLVAVLPVLVLVPQAHLVLPYLLRLVNHLVVVFPLRSQGQALPPHQPVNLNPNLQVLHYLHRLLLLRVLLLVPVLVKVVPHLNHNLPPLVRVLVKVNQAPLHNPQAHRKVKALLHQKVLV